jgi:hypothetical protein
MYVKIQPNYYAGTINAPSASLAKDEDGEIIDFETREEAQEWIDKTEDYGTYYLSHGEADPPTHTIIYGNEEDDCRPASGHLGGGAEEITADQIPAELLDELQRANVEWLYSERDYDVYTAYLYNRDGWDYAIVYCPTHIALEFANVNHGGDLGSINWDNEAYYRIPS